MKAGESELEDPLAAERTADAVVEFPEALAGEVRLIVARVEVIGDIEDLEADGRLVIEQSKPFGNLRVERHEPRIAPDVVAWPDEVAVRVEVRQRKPGSDVEHGKHGEAARERQARPKEGSIRRVPREGTARVGANHRILDVAEKAVEVVQVANGRRSRERADD